MHVSEVFKDGRLIAYSAFVAKVNGRSIRKRFGLSKCKGDAKAARAAAEAWAKRKAAQVKAARERASLLSEAQLVDASRAIFTLEDAGMATLSLCEAVEFYLKAQEKPNPTVRKTEGWTFAQAADALIKNRQGRGAKPYYLAQLTKQLHAFCRWHGAKRMDDIDLALVEKWLDGRKGKHGRTVKPVTRGNYLRDLSMVWNFAVARGKASANPLKGLEKPIAEEDEGITVLTPEECASLLYTAQTFAYLPSGQEADRWRQLTTYLALRLFSGIRRSELTKMSFDDLHLDAREIIVPAEAAKTRHRRPVSISENLLAWIKVSLDQNFHMPDLSTRRLFSLNEEQLKWRWTLLQRHAGVKVPQNALRHSWFSYHLALHRNPGLTHREGAHASEAMMYRHYARLVKTDAARAFFSILPACRLLDRVPEFRNRKPRRG
jgi:integrase